MRKNYFMFVVLLVVLFGVISVSAQENQIKPNKTYKIYTYTIVGSNDSGNKSNLPQNLAGEFNKIKSNFGYSNYELLSTQFQLIKQGGSVSYKSILKNLDTSNKNDSPVFADWGFSGFGNESGKEKVQVGFKSFRFNMRFPVKRTFVNTAGIKEQKTNYEALGISAQNIDFVVGKPVMFASFPVEVSDKTLFFAIHLEESK